MKQWDYVAEDRGNWPAEAVRSEENPDKQSRVRLIFYNSDGDPLCSAKRVSWTPDEPRYCGNTILGAGGRCRMHGGVTGPTGVSHPLFKHGRYSKSLPSRLAARYEDSENDPELMSLKEEVRLIDARVADLIMNAHEGGASDVFKEIARAWKSFRYAEADGDSQKMTDAGRRLDESIKEGQDESRVWEQVNKLIDLRRKMALAEGKRLQMLDQFLTVEQVNVLLAGALAIIAREVTDRATVAKVVLEFSKLTGERDRQSSLPPASDVIEAEYEASQDE